MFLCKLKIVLSSSKTTLNCTALLEKTVVGIRLTPDRSKSNLDCVQEHFLMKHLSNLNNDFKKIPCLLNNLVLTVPFKMDVCTSKLNANRYNFVIISPP